MHWNYCACVLVTCVLLVTVHVWICIVCTLFSNVPFMYSLISLSVSVYSLLLRVRSTATQAVSRRLPTAAARVQTRVWSCGIL
jgi:hypothetical protein